MGGTRDAPPRPVRTVTLLVKHDCPFSRPVSTAEGVRVTHLCHRGKETMLEVHARDPKDLDRLVSEYEGIGGELLYREPDGGAALVRFPSCACCGSGQVIPTIERSGHLYLPPSAYSAEGESYQFLAEERRLKSNLLESFPTGVEVVRMGTNPLTSLEFEGGFLVPVGALFRGLTDRQRLAIVTAILRGYYRIPHAVTTEELARGFGISRPAFDALLRKAENKLAGALFPYLTVQSSEAAEPSQSTHP
jgi:predicted DNA binding protein